MSDFRYPAVAALAAVYLPRNRKDQAAIVDNMLATRDTQIDQLKTDVRDRDAAIERYMLENAELCGFIGRVRNVLLDAHHSTADFDTKYVELAQAVDRVLALAIPGAAAKPKKTLYQHFRARIQLCGHCDRRTVCAMLLAGAAPCGENKWVSVEEGTR